MTRRGKLKSHTGCIRCKARKVKCDEGTPCQNCSRRGETCSLTAQSNRNDGSISREEWMQDMELMHHYTNHVCQTPMGARDSVRDIFRVYIPNEAMKYEFLLHILLALSALNLTSIHPSEARRYLDLCDKHQTAALRGFRMALSGDINSDKGNALFACAATISLSAMARSTATAAIMPDPKYIDMDNVAQLFLLTRGVGDVRRVASISITSGPLSPMLDGYHVPESERQARTFDLPAVVTTRFAQLREFLEKHHSLTSPPNSSTALTTALDHLVRVYDCIRYFSATAVVESGQIWGWPVAVPLQYIQLIESRDPAALILLAHFAAATTACEVWYTDHWAEHCFQRVMMALDVSLHHWLEWPREQIEQRLAVLHG